MILAFSLLQIGDGYAVFHLRRVPAIHVLSHCKPAQSLRSSSLAWRSPFCHWAVYLPVTFRIILRIKMNTGIKIAANNKYFMFASLTVRTKSFIVGGAEVVAPAPLGLTTLAILGLPLWWARRSCPPECRPASQPFWRAAPEVFACGAFSCSFWPPPLYGSIIEYL